MLNKKAFTSKTQFFLQNLVVMVLYIIVGRLGLFLAVPPGYATIIWPPSGIALGSVLTRGLFTLPGIGLGSFIVNILITLSNSRGESIWQIISISGTIACGAVLQALAGWVLVKKLMGPTINLDKVWVVIKFFFLAGPVSCLVNATFSNISLFFHGSMNESQLLHSWITWWGGDALGVIIITPIILAFLGRPRELWSGRIKTVALPLLVAFFLTIFVFYETLAIEQTKVLEDVNVRSEFILVSGLLFSSLLGGFLLILAGKNELLKLEASKSSLTLAALKESETLKSEILEASLDAIVTIDERGHIVEFNQSAEVIFKYKKQDVMGKSMADIIVPARYRKAHHDGLKRFLATGVGPFIGKRLETSAQRSDGSEFPVELSIVALHVKGQRIFTAFLRDITERKGYEKSLNDSKNIAEQANQTKDDFLATLSHELRTPLTLILSWTQLIQQKFDTEKIKHGIKMIEQSAKTQNQLINDLLDISRIRSGKLLMNFSTVDPKQLVILSIEAVQMFAMKKNINIESEIKTQSEKIWCDPERFLQIMWNLLTNAIKFSPQNSVIRVRVETIVEHSKELVSIKIIDQGKGISSEFLPKIFERFSQADSSSVRTHGGLGLGLAIVHDLIKLHEGSVQAESEGLGKGATFTILLPVKSAMSPIKNQPKENARPANLSGLNVMIIEDDPSTLEVLNETLNSFGAKTIACSSVNKALLALKHFNPNILVSDISMPDEDGCSLIRKVRKLDSKSYCHVPAIALTALASKDDEQRALSSGFSAHLAKPCDMVYLSHLIAKLANQRLLLSKN